MAKGMFASGHIDGMTNELAAQITSQVAMSDKVAGRHPYSVYNRERLTEFYDQRPKAFSSQYGYGLPFKVSARRWLPRALAPGPRVTV